MIPNQNSKRKKHASKKRSRSFRNGLNMWRTLLAICRRVRLHAAAAVLISVPCMLCAEGVKSSGTAGTSSSSSSSASSVEMPKIDTTILLPSMPVITAPTLGSSFYTPGEIYRGPSRSSSKTQTSPQSAQTSAQTVSQSSASADAAGTASPASPAQPSVNAAVLQQLATAGGSASGSTVTASDLTSFDSAGLLGSFYSMLGGSSAQQSSSVSASSQNKLLTEILAELSDLKT